MTPAEDGPSLDEMEAERNRLDTEIASRKAEEKKTVIAQIVDVANRFDVTAQEIVNAMGGLKPTKGKKVEAKYRDPITGATWAGRGREPLWIKGRDHDEFLIND